MGIDFERAVYSALKKSAGANANAITRREISISATAELLNEWFLNISDRSAHDVSAASGAYYFVFWKNLSVTNVSIAELMALLRRFTKHRDAEKTESIEIMSFEDFKTFFQNTISSFLDDNFLKLLKSNENKRKLSSYFRKISSKISLFHGDLISRTLLMDTFWTSSVIGIPRSLSCDVQKITANSGYIHSAGCAIYSRSNEKANGSEIIDKLRSFLVANRSTKKKLGKYFISPYAKEFFEPYEHESSTSIRNGLDSIRISLRKHVIERLSLVDFLQNIGNQFRNEIIVAQGLKKYSEERKDAKNKGARSDCTIWIVVDAKIRFDNVTNLFYKIPGNMLFIYAQRFFNQNELNIYKERKPAWIASTTIPHTLSSALFNISLDMRLSFLDKKLENDIVVLDPFCGTGTSLFDSALRCRGAKIIGFDSSRMMPFSVLFNKHFLSLNQDKIYHLEGFVRDVIGTIKRYIEDKTVSEKDTQDFLLSVRTFDSEIALINDSSGRESLRRCMHYVFREIARRTGKRDIIDITEADIARAAESEFTESFLDLMTENSHRVDYVFLMFSIWRAMRLNTFGLRPERRNARSLFRIINNELEIALKEISDHMKLRKSNYVGNLGMFEICEGTYSFGSRLNIKEMDEIVIKNVEEAKFSTESCHKGITTVCVNNSIDLLRKNQRKFDIIITDPPFGFNAFESHENIDDLQRLYSELIPCLVGAVKEYGQLVIALPAFAKNGRSIPYYQTHTSVSKQIFSSAERMGRACINIARIASMDRRAVAAPFYWGGQSAVERRILCFTIK